MPDWKPEIRARLAGLNLEPAREAAMVEEISQHLDDRFAELRAGGSSVEEAARRTLDELRSDDYLPRELWRIERRAEIETAAFGATKVNLLEDLYKDLRHAARILLKNPGFTAIAVLTLALGIGANTAIFSVVNAVLVRPLPYKEPGRIVAVCESNPRLGLDQYVASMGAYADWRAQSSCFEQLAAATVLGPSPILGKSDARLIHAGAVSADFFPMLGIQPILGRQLAREEENPAHGSAILLSEGLWRGQFGGDPGILGQSVRLGDRNFTVAGVMPANVKLFDPAGVQGWDNGFSKCDLWRPLPVDSGLRNQRSYRAFLVLGRLKPLVTLPQAQNEMRNLARAAATEFPDANAGWTIVVRPWQQIIVRNARTPLVLLWSAVVLVLIIATANLANLCLARATTRQKEFAVRMALGAGRFRMARQLLAESLLLSSIGGASGLLFARWSIGLARGMIPANIPRADEINLDGTVLAFSAAVTLIVGMLFGLAPLLTLWRRDVNSALKAETRGSTGSLSGRRLRAWLVASEVALVVILLTGAGLLARSFQRLQQANLGFQPDHLLAMDVSIGNGSFTNGLRRIEFVEQLAARISSLPGVDSAAAVDGLPLDANRGNMDIALTRIDGNPPAAPGGKVLVELRLVSPEYFRTMGVGLARGRFFTQQDRTNSAAVVIINQTLARRYFPGQDPVGRRISSPDLGTEPCEIAGVVNDIKQASLDANAGPEVFRPLLQECFFSVSIVARSRSAPGPIFDAIRREATGLDMAVPASNSRTLDQLIGASLAPRQFALWLTGSLAGIALLLALVGIYGVLSCMVNELAVDIGLRLALGAQRSQVLRMVLWRGMCAVIVGGAVGLAGACAFTRLLRRLLYEVSPTDPLTLLLTASLLVVAALAACWLPARRAASVDPMETLRCE